MDIFLLKLVPLTNERVGHVVPLGGNPKLEIFYVSLSKKHN